MSKMNSASTSSLLDCGAMDPDNVSEIAQILEREGITFRLWVTQDDYDPESVFWVDEVLTQAKLNQLAHQYPVLADCSLQELICGQLAQPVEPLPRPEAIAVAEQVLALRQAGCAVVIIQPSELVVQDPAAVEKMLWEQGRKDLIEITPGSGMMPAEMETAWPILQGLRDHGHAVVVIPPHYLMEDAALVEQQLPRLLPALVPHRQQFELQMH